MVGVGEIDESLELFNEGRGIAESVGHVGSFGETDIGNVELSQVSGIVDSDVVKNGESVGDGHDETIFAAIVEIGGKSFNSADKESFPVFGALNDNSLDFLGGDFIVILLISGILVTFLLVLVLLVLVLLVIVLLVIVLGLSEEGSFGTVGLEDRGSLGSVFMALIQNSLDIESFL